MTGTAVVPQKPLAERIYDRVKGQLGDMVTDDDLRPLVARAMEDAFFAPRPQFDHWGNKAPPKVPYLVEMVQAQMEKAVREHVEAWFTTHPEVAAKAIEEVIAKGVLAVTFQALEVRMQQPLYELVQKLRDAGARV